VKLKGITNQGMQRIAARVRIGSVDDYPYHHLSDEDWIRVVNWVYDSLEDMAVTLWNAGVKDTVGEGPRGPGGLREFFDLKSFQVWFSDTYGQQIEADMAEGGYDPAFSLKELPWRLYNDIDGNLWGIDFPENNLSVEEYEEIMRPGIYDLISGIKAVTEKKDRNAQSFNLDVPFDDIDHEKLVSIIEAALERIATDVWEYHGMYEELLEDVWGTEEAFKEFLKYEVTETVQQWAVEGSIEGARDIANYVGSVFDAEILGEAPMYEVLPATESWKEDASDAAMPGAEELLKQLGIG